jgi:hypothetical protein
VLFVGTMNEDESTLTLSDKVLDRASVLTFPAPKGMTLKQQPGVTPASHRLPYETWKEWITVGKDDEISLTLNQINDIMSELDRPFGHRLFRAIHAYLVNYPGDPKHALSDQFAMKILPRLRGLECDDTRVKRGLDQLKTHVPGELADAFLRSRERDFFAWTGSSEMYAVKQ